MNKLKLALQFGDIPAPLSFNSSQAVLTWLLEIPTSKEIAGGQGHTPWPDVTYSHILAFPARNRARRRWWRISSQRDNLIWHVAAFPLQWLWGGWAVGEKRWWAEQEFFAFSLFYQSRVGELGLVPGSGLNMHGGGKMRLVSKPLPKRRLRSPSGSMASHPSGLRLPLLGLSGEVSKAVLSLCPQAHPSGRGSRSASRVSVQASVSPPGAKTSRTVIFSPAYRNRKLPSCPFLLAENRQLREGPVRAGRTSSPRTLLLGGSCCGPGYF